jgi:hypothetical protein
MKKLVVLCLVALIIGVFGFVYAADNVDQTVTYQVSAINEISVSGNPSALTVNAATAGSEPTAVTDASTTYAITTNQSSRKITGVLNSAMPSNTTLKVTLGAPTGGSSAGQVTLTASAADLVTGISTLAESGLSISYEFSATSAAGVVASAQKTVTLTVADGS